MPNREHGSSEEVPVLDAPAKHACLWAPALRSVLALVDKKPRAQDEKLFSILSEGKLGKSNGISDPALFDTLVRYSEGMTSPKHCPDQSLKGEYFKAKEEGGALKTIKTVYYLGEAKIPTSKGTEDYHSYLELSWDGSGKWRRYAKKKAD